MSTKISKESPLAEITLRKYETPNSEMNLYEISRRTMLTLGLLQPGDSRDVIVDVFLAIITNEGLTATEVEDKAKQIRQERDAGTQGLTAPNIRRQILRLKNMFLVNKQNGYYRLAEGTNILAIWEDHIKNYYLEGILRRVTETIKTLDEVLRKHV